MASNTKSRRSEEEGAAAPSTPMHSEIAAGPADGPADEAVLRWLPDSAEDRMHELAMRQSSGTMTSEEAAEYAVLVEEAQRLMVENARALTRRRGAATYADALRAERRALHAARLA
jgi:hypothetical protein